MALCLALAGLAWAAAPAQDPLRIGLTLFVLIGSLWVTRALNLSVTALLVPLLAALAGVLSPREALAPFAHPVVFLFLGGFALAAALGHHGLDRVSSWRWPCCDWQDAGRVRPSFCCSH